MKHIKCILGFHKFSEGRVTGKDEHRLPSIIPFDRNHEDVITMTFYESSCMRSNCNKKVKYFVGTSELKRIQDAKITLEK
jgi:hypothetical protein